MTTGQVVENGPAARIFRHPEHPYTEQLLRAQPRGVPAPHDPAASVVMRCEQLRVWFPIKRGLLNKTVDHVKAVDGIDVELRVAETLGVVGESGSGKSSLGLALLRLIRSQGSIVLDGQEIQGLRNRELRPLRGEMQIVFQDPYGSLSPRLSAFPDRRGGAVGSGGFPTRRAPTDRSGGVCGGGSGSRSPGSLPARIFWRAAPAHRHRPRSCSAPENPGFGRADQRAGT